METTTAPDLVPDDPMVVLLDELHSASALDAVASLGVFATALGEERVRDDLVPFFAGQRGRLAGKDERERGREREREWTTRRTRTRGDEEV